MGRFLCFVVWLSVRVRESIGNEEVCFPIVCMCVFSLSVLLVLWVLLLGLGLLSCLRNVMAFRGNDGPQLTGVLLALMCLRGS